MALINFKNIFTAIFLLALTAAFTQATALETVYFSSAVQPKGNSSAATQKGFPIWGHIGKPKGDGPFPAIVLMHGCGGVHGNHEYWANELTKQGYVALVIDSFGPRSVFSICSKPSRKVKPRYRALDAYGALEYFRTLAYVDMEKTAVIGWSHGGMSALAAVASPGFPSRFKAGFKTAIAFYPYCIPDRKYDLPVLIMIGDADDWTPANLCEKLAAANKRKDGSNTIEFISYPNAYHAFDDVALEPNGFSIKDFYGTMHLLKYNRKAHLAAASRLKSFLTEQFSK